MGCRTTTDASDLLRLALPARPGPRTGPDAPAVAPDAVAPDADARVEEVRRVVVDVRRRLGGRGAWLHPDPACLALAERRRAVPRALRAPAPLDLTAVADHLASRPPSP
ncbi:YlxR family protein [Pseudokineococcus sp. 1T1Z-3]|uniref:YlxR family protein n=1 Tax=Pseudokineococcus sp. 1T1Z-3 TaxID=3132745 RepID=UPI0030ABDB5A